MGVFIQDTARNNLATWTVHAIAGGYALGAVLSPFTSPRLANGFKRDAAEVAATILDAGGECWFDATTYALGMPRAGDFRHYDSWPLWTGTRGQLSSGAEQVAHVEAVFAVQAELGVPFLAPTVLVSYPDTPQSQVALQVTREALSIAPSAWATIAGDHQFWSAGAELDAHVGALDQTQPAGWLLVVGRSDNAMRPGATADEVDLAVDGLKPTNWLDVMGVNQVTGTFMLKWYKVLAIDDETRQSAGSFPPRDLIDLPGAGNSQIGRYLMVQGPPWPTSSMTNLGVAILPGIIDVYTRVMQME